jgi:ribosomal protein S18 acetylase RimI-like enzyme
MFFGLVEILRFVKVWRMMKFRFITPQDPEYDQELMLRWEVLSKPLGMPPGSQIVEQESKSFHLIAVDRKKLVGCVLFFPENDSHGLLFQMALSEEYQGKGFGRRLISMLEHTLLEKGYKEVYLLAPPEKIGFYERMGYENEGEPVKQNGIFCQRMVKRLHDK